MADRKREPAPSPYYLARRQNQPPPQSSLLEYALIAILLSLLIWCAVERIARWLLS